MTILIISTITLLIAALVMANIALSKSFKETKALLEINKGLRERNEKIDDRWWTAMSSPAVVVNQKINNWYTVKKGDMVIAAFCDPDPDYNRICAEELAQHINEKI